MWKVLKNILLMPSNGVALPLLKGPVLVVISALTDNLKERRFMTSSLKD
jgi:hypothetical protein